MSNCYSVKCTKKNICEFDFRECQKKKNILEHHPFVRNVVGGSIVGFVVFLICENNPFIAAIYLEGLGKIWIFMFSHRKDTYKQGLQILAKSIPCIRKVPFCELKIR